MLTTSAIKHFGTQSALADAIGIKQASVAEWGKYPPPLRQVQIETITNGQLKAEKGILPKPMVKAA